MKIILSFGLFLSLIPRLTYAQYDFTLNRYGPSSVVQGYHNYSILQITLTEGVGENAFVSFKDLPPASEVDVHSARIHCCGFTNGVARLYRPGNAEIRISPSLDTPAGTYPVKFVVQSGGVTKELQYDLTVLEAPPPLARVKPDSSPVPIPELARWESQMLTYGDRFCDFNRFPNMSYGWEGDVWYYDGAWVYYQIANYTGNLNKWRACGDGILNVYRQWVLDVTMQGYRVFPHGISDHYRRTKETGSLDALKRLITHTTYGNQGGHVHPSYIRETAYMLHTYRLNREEGQPNHYYHYPASPQNSEHVPGIERSAAFLLGHLQHFLERKKSKDWLDRFCPFMKGLALHALIEYYQYRLERENIADPRIPKIVAEIADLIWEEAWRQGNEAFYYEWYPGNALPTSGAPDLNLLIAPAYAWLWQKTGENKYRERGDQAFAGGVKGAWLGGGKQFSQNYRWSPDYVKWRSTLPEWIGINSVQIEQVTSTTATISWLTDKPGIPAIEYGPSATYVETAAGSATPATEHRITLSGLKPGGNYHFRVTTWDKSTSEPKRFVSEDFSFTTVAGPVPNAPARLRIKE